MKTMSMENVSTGVRDKNKDYFLRSKDIAEISYDIMRHVQLHMSVLKKLTIYNTLRQTYSPTVV